MDASLARPDGTPIKMKDAIVYLGSFLSSSGHGGSELSRRLGMAKADFMLLARIWSHSSLPRWRKLSIQSLCDFEVDISLVHYDAGRG